MGIFLEKNELKDAYNDSVTWTEDWQKPFDEYERIANNKLSKLISKNMPKVNDGSLAASLIETPMQVLPVMQMGKFTPMNKKDAWLGEIVNIIWKKRIIPGAITQASFFAKEQIALYRALKYGAQPRYNFFVSNEQYTGSDWSLPYIKNVKLEPGKLNVEDSDYLFMDVYFTKLQLKKLIENIKTENTKAKAEGAEADTSWSIEALQKLVDTAVSNKEYKDMNSKEKEATPNASGIKAIICFNRGKDAPFFMFSNNLASDEIIREWENPDPTGDLPITMQYCYETLESPYGIGRVELAGPTQNVLDYFTQAHVLATQLGLEPPRKVKGNTESTNLKSIVNAPNALWMVGNAEIEPVQTTTGVYNQFSTNYGLYKSQLMNLQGRTDGSVSAESGNPEFSKTPAGIKLQSQRTNAQDNYLRNQADTASATMATKMINVHMAKMHGADIIDIVQDDYDRLTKAGYFDDNPSTSTPSVSEIEINYENLRDTFKFEYDARPEADEGEKSRWIELLDIVASNPNILPMLQQSGYSLELGEMFKKIIIASGADDWEKVLTKLEPEAIGDGSINETGMEGGTQGGGEFDPNDPEKINMVMSEYGVDEKTAQFMIDASGRGYGEDEILALIDSKKREANG